MPFLELFSEIFLHIIGKVFLDQDREAICIQRWHPPSKHTSHLLGRAGEDNKEENGKVVNFEAVGIPLSFITITINGSSTVRCF